MAKSKRLCQLHPDPLVLHVHNAHYQQPEMEFRSFCMLRSPHEFQLWSDGESMRLDERYASEMHLRYLNH
jgi:hypothetical protein